MDTSIGHLKRNSGLKSKWEILQKTHIAILSTGNVKFRIFPIYIQYIRGGDLIAILYYKGKFVGPGELTLGLNLKNKLNFSRLRKAEYMRYSGINYSYKLKDVKDLDKSLMEIVSLIT